MTRRIGLDTEASQAHRGEVPSTPVFVSGGAVRVSAV